ncbi:hypothetical protein AN478_02070 [Thiohalorhabdus denitrificans]|uniref:Uncharacterized protein n=1 Tax=Thiohalorhabdus denitrificans TaxID=381306 RepID=A0A0P9ES42_9GAMM|nr:hypothetical protein [Thiohalorhabdus denitrificans]KPV41388.1 hypothetical protein AN478_02070 [Thiohalorhabdus denitrificans]SCY25544.1 hypothetical protein SAMN05661077_1604 [Thiohalorhabdus denitrificans]
MAINEHWGTGFEVNRDPNAGVRRDMVPDEDAGWARATGKVGACSAAVHEIRPLTHELTIGGILGMGGTHLYVTNKTDIRWPDGSPVELGEIREGDQVAAIYQEVEHRSFEVADEQGPERQLEAIHLVVVPREHGKGEG